MDTGNRAGATSVPTTNGTGPGRNLKTPESFLGENSGLVNLENLIGPPRASSAGNPAGGTNSGSDSRFHALPMSIRFHSMLCW